ncbi:MAG TPA: hypothetical protein VGK45_01775, partial [Thermoanaerobaculia bacterium]
MGDETDVVEAGVLDCGQESRDLFIVKPPVAFDDHGTLGIRVLEMAQQADQFARGYRCLRDDHGSILAHHLFSKLT